MQHTIVVLFLVTLIAGTVSLFTAGSIYVRTRDRTIGYFLTLFTGLSIQMAAHLALAYYLVVGGSPSALAFKTLLAFVAISIFAMAFAIIAAMERLRGGKGAGNRTIAALIAVSLCLFASLFSCSVDPAAGVVRFTAFAFSLLCLPVAIVYSAMLGVAFVMHMPAGNERSCLKGTAVVTIVFFPFFLVSLLMPGLAGSIPIGVNMFSVIPFSVFYLVLSAVFAIFANRRYFSLLDGSKVAANIAPFPDDDFCREWGISPREREVMTLMLEGNDNKSIARALGISTNTVKVHASNVFRKLGVQSRFELTKFRAEATRKAVDSRH